MRLNDASDNWWKNYEPRGRQGPQTRQDVIKNFTDWKTREEVKAVIQDHKDHDDSGFTADERGMTRPLSSLVEEAERNKERWEYVREISKGIFVGISLILGTIALNGAGEYRREPRRSALGVQDALPQNGDESLPLDSKSSFDEEVVKN